jgi:peptidoglycan/xylan/chitin deacetylase (PgdA/CDA1 family)
MLVTTSWDDGHPADQRVLELLSARALKGTFYIPSAHPEVGKVDGMLVRRLHAEGAEIGVHTLTHPDLRRLSPDHIRHEVGACKQWLEGLLGAEVDVFSYPFGFHNDRAAAIVGEMGFRYARTLRYDYLRRPHRPLRAGVSVQAADASPRLVAQTWLDTRGPPSVLTDWVVRAKRAFDVARQRDGVWHLWGHSWEIDRHADWSRLESVLDYVARVPGVQYLTNGDGLVLR